MWQLLLTLAFNLTLNFQGQIKYLICYILWQNDPIALKRPQKHLKFIMTLTCYFQVKLLHLRDGRADWCEIKRKWIDWLLSQQLDVDLLPYAWPWPWIFKVKVWNSLISETGGLIDMEQKGCESVIHVHDHDLSVTKMRGDFRCPCAIDWCSFIGTGY